jgi:hypothetical protein
VIVGNHEDILSQNLFPYSGGPTEARLVAIDPAEQETLAGLCVRMRKQLDTDHVICPESRAKELCLALRGNNSTVREILEDGFYRLLTIEVANGLDSNEKFNHDGHFLPYVREVLYSSFGVDPTDDYHPEQIVQVVKDEPPSLFCFLDAHHIQGPDVQRLRIFTQGPHRVLLCPLPSPPGSIDPGGATATSPSHRVVTSAGHPQSLFALFLILSGPSAGR